MEPARSTQSEQIKTKMDDRGFHSFKENNKKIIKQNTKKLEKSYKIKSI